MHYVEKLPFILGALAALVAGMLSFGTGISQQALYMRMAVSMLIFFFIGLYARSTILEITKEIELKEKEKEEELQKVQDKIPEKSQEKTLGKTPGKTQEKTPEGTTRITDEKAGDDEFQPLKVNDIIKAVKTLSTKENNNGG